MALSKAERDRLVVLRQVKEGKLKQATAAKQLKLSRRWVRKLLKRLRAEGDRGLAHRLRGRPSNRAHDDELRRRALDLIRERYDDYGPTLASEMLASERASDRSEPRDAAAVDERPRTVEAAAREIEESACLATAAALPGRAGAMGHVRPRVAGRARTAVVSGGNDR